MGRLSRTVPITVIKGTFMAGKGDKFDADASEALPAGSFDTRSE